MKRIGDRFVPLLLVALIILATGCAPPGTTRTPLASLPKVWILDPQDGAILKLAPHKIRLQGASFIGIAGFEVLINGTKLGMFAPTTSGSGGPEYGTMFFAETPWTPPGVGSYEILARAKDGQDQFSPSVSVNVTVKDFVSQDPGTALFDPYHTPTPPTGRWQARVTMNANCRAGDGTNYNETGFLPQGSSAEVVGRNEAGSWLEVTNPNGIGTCWASIIAFETAFAIDELPVHVSEAEPIPENEGEAQGGRKATGCLVTNPFTGQRECQSPCPAGVRGPACTP